MVTYKKGNTVYRNGEVISTNFNHYVRKQRALADNPAPAAEENPAPAARDNPAPAAEEPATAVPSSPIRLEKGQVRGKASDVFLVSKILNDRQRHDGQGYEYLIKWSFYKNSDNTWEPESNLAGSYRILKAYKTLKKLDGGKPTCEEMMGCAPNIKPEDFNESVWCKLTDIVDRLNILRRKYDVGHNLPLEVIRSELKPRSGDKLILVPMDSHCYVGLYIGHSKTCFLADGANFLHEAEAIKSTRHIFRKINVIRLHYRLQSKVDHCGSSACCIGVELSRLYKVDPTMQLTVKKYQKEGRFTLFSPKSIREATRKILNPGESKSNPEGPSSNMGRRIYHKCPKCNWSSNKTNRRALVMHMRQVQTSPVRLGSLPAFQVT